ncbi:MAG: NAD(P)/FAD-dependent oxidoreductase [Bacteroidales bacterium]|jgi:prolycopene isomerase|nr:NAD(P)/FAD-dependent oxidoreductase [Bacteroidales bacterium]
MNENNSDGNYDVIVIGGGISGLTSAGLFSRLGYKVAVLEMSHRPGGYISGFKRHKYRFDSAIHWLNQTNKNGLVSRIFDIIGEDYPKTKQQKRIKRYKNRNHDYILTSNPEELRSRLISDFPHETNGINKFFERAKKIGRSFDNYNKLFLPPGNKSIIKGSKAIYELLRFIKPLVKLVRYSGEKGTTKGLKKFFTDQKLLDIFCAEEDILSCLVPIAWAYYGDYQSPPQGGSQMYAEWLEYITQYYNNQIFYRGKAESVIVDNGICRGVKYSVRGKEHTIYGNNIISTCNIETLYNELLPKGTVSAKLIDKLENAKLYSSSFTISLGLNCPAEDLGLGEESVHYTTDNILRKDHNSGDPYKTALCILAPSVRDKTLAPEGKGTLTIYIPANIEYRDFWQTERDADGNFIRTDAYKKLKKEIADILINRVEELLIPNLKEHIDYIDIATPITNYRYTGNKNGTIMGAKPGKENMKARIAHYKTSVKNLYVSGHWSELGGGVPIAVKSAMNTALLILKNINKPAYENISLYMTGKLNINDLENAGILTMYDNSYKPEPTPAQKV